MLKTLTPYIRSNQILIWHDRMIPAGGNWDRHIHVNLESADMIVTIMSVDFIASVYCHDIEMERALERHKAQEAVLLPVWLNDCPWPEQLAGVQRVPSKTAILNCRNRDTQFTLVASEIARTAGNIREGMLVHEPAVSAHTPSRKPAVPPLLKYLCNRAEQCKALDLAIRARTEADWRRPLVFILHGTVSDFYDAFLERLRASGLPKLLYPNSRKPLQKLRLPWPAHYSPSLSLFDLFSYQLASCIPGTSDCQNFIEFAARLPSDAINLMVASVDPSEWKQRGEPLLLAFLSLWEQWPEVPASARLIVCLVVEYPRSGGNDSETDVGRTVANLEKNQGRKPSVVILPRLESVTKAEVDVWSEQPEIGNFLKDEDKVLQLKQEIGKLYTEEAAIPMLQLVPRLQDLLENVF